LNVEERINTIIAEQLGLAVADIKPESILVDDLGADSLDLIEIVMAAEEEFEQEISDAAADRVRTVQQAFDLIHSLV
jgi:acyl carrier protein